MPKYSIVLPCYNESANLPVLVDRFRPFAQRWDFELILVNNGSTDDSALIMEQVQQDPSNAFVRIVTIETNIGYGHGIHTGLEAAEGEILAYSHADVQTPPEDIFRAFELIERGDVVIERTVIKGLRPGRDETHVLTRWLRILTRLLTGLRVEDINGQPKVFHRSLLDAMDRPVTDFAYDTYVLYVASREGRAIQPIEVEFGERLHGESKWASTLLKKYRTIASYLRSLFLMAWRNRGR